MTKNEKETDKKLSSDWDGYIIPQKINGEQQNKLFTTLLLYSLVKRPNCSRDC